MAFVYDYKAAHKVAAKHVKLAVAKETLFMEVIEQLNSNKSRIGAELEPLRARRTWRCGQRCGRLLSLQSYCPSSVSHP
jgi:hypothetical protein